MSRIRSYRQGVDGTRVENFTGFTTLQIFVEIQKMITEILCEPEQFDRKNHLHVNVERHCMGRKKGNEEMFIANSQIQFAKRFEHGHWSCLGPESEKKWWWTHTCTPNGKWDRVAGDMMLKFCKSGKHHTMCKCALSMKDDSCCFHDIRLGSKTSV